MQVKRMYNTLLDKVFVQFHVTGSRSQLVLDKPCPLLDLHFIVLKITCSNFLLKCYLFNEPYPEHYTQKGKLSLSSTLDTYTPNSPTLLYF